jgi:hypothetical protein
MLNVVCAVFACFGLGSRVTRSFSTDGQALSSSSDGSSWLEFIGPRASRIGRCLLLMALPLVFRPTPLPGEAVNGRISGIVSDRSGAVVPHVRVEARNTQTGAVQATETDSVGFYNFAALAIDLLALQPGVVPISSGEYSGAYAPSGSLNPGTLSVDGGRENFNGYFVNGANESTSILDRKLTR